MSEQEAVLSLMESARGAYLKTCMRTTIRKEGLNSISYERTAISDAEYLQFQSCLKYIWRMKQFFETYRNNQYSHRW